VQYGEAIDVGIMQINLHWHGHRVNDPAELLDPETNLLVGASVLATAIRSAPDDLALGIGRYHSWQEKRARDYGKRVLAIVHNLQGL
jgi:soluble lytic murein transglycosylase-like protein